MSNVIQLLPLVRALPNNVAPRIIVAYNESTPITVATQPRRSSSCSHNQPSLPPTASRRRCRKGHCCSTQCSHPPECTSLQSPLRMSAYWRAYVATVLFHLIGPTRTCARAELWALRKSCGEFWA